jgi:hypothetical protein
MLHCRNLLTCGYSGLFSFLSIICRLSFHTVFYILRGFGVRRIEYEGVVDTIKSLSSLQQQLLL